MRQVTMIIAVLACIAAIPIVSAAAMSVGIGSMTGAQGSSLDVPLIVGNAKDLGSMDIVIYYDPAVLSVVSVEKGSLNQGMISANTDTPGIISMGLLDPAGMNGDGAVAVIRFKAIGANGATTPLGISSVLAYNVKTHIDIQTASNGGTFTVKQGSAGAPGFEAVMGILSVVSLLIIRKIK